MWVVKIGGSLIGDPRLAQWLDMLASVGGGRVVIVPGGGPFADHVRASQRKLGFDDRTAHNLAVLAMAQYGALLHGACSALVPADSTPAIVSTLKGERVALWMPLEALRWTADVLADWDITSDSLAAWLANRLPTTRLVLVKACEVPAGRTPSQYTELGIVDARFAEFVQNAPYGVDIVSATELPRIEAALNLT
jgi:aspartokinase-like uncharacterized kinase